MLKSAKPINGRRHNIPTDRHPVDLININDRKKIMKTRVAHTTQNNTTCKFFINEKTFSQHSVKFSLRVWFSFRARHYSPE